LFISKNHPVTEEITLSLQVEKIAKSPKVQAFFHQISLPKACATSSIKIKLLDCANLAISYIQEGFQKVC
jgi:hypothetical protein